MILDFKLIDRLQTPMAWDIQHQGENLNKIQPASIPEVLKLISNMLGKLLPLDFVKTSLIKSCADIFAPIISPLANLSFTEGKFSTGFKLAQITPILKKENLNPDSPANYRPVSNLNTISKLLENYLSRLKQHVAKLENFNKFQSAYKQHHSTEFTLLEILSDVYRSTDNRKQHV